MTIESLRESEKTQRKFSYFILSPLLLPPHYYYYYYCYLPSSPLPGASSGCYSIHDREHFPCINAFDSKYYTG